MTQTYRHSGRFSPVGIVAGIVAGVVAGFPLAYLYARGIIKIDEQHLAFMATMAYGAGVGAAVARALKWGKVRNSMIGGAAAVLPGAVSLYWSWAFWVKNIISIFEQQELDAFSLMSHPQALWRVITLINQDGTWGSTSTNMTKGAELWFIWGGEALLVLGIAASVAYLVLEAQPFCEKCQLWCMSNEKLRLSPGNPSFIRQSLFKRDLTFLEKLGPGNNKTSYITAHLHSCRNCGELNTLTLTQTDIVKPIKWYQRAGVRRSALIEKFLLSRAEADAFRNTAQSVKQLSQAAKA